MKNKIYFKLMLSIALVLLFVNETKAADFNTDGIYYNVLSEEDNTVEVTNNGINSYAGGIIIPQTVTNIATSRTYTVKEIKMGAFWGCEKLTSVKLPEQLETINTYAFAYCKNLTSIILSSATKSIRDYAFRDCYSLTKIEIPALVEEIGTRAFYHCFELSNITVKSETPAVCQDDTFEGIDTQECTIFVPSATAIDSYKAASGWSNFTNIRYSSGTEKITQDLNVRVCSINGGISICGAENIDIKIYSSNGILVTEINNYSNEDIMLNTGFYFLKVGTKVQGIVIK